MLYRIFASTHNNIPDMRACNDRENTVTPFKVFEAKDESEAAEKLNEYYDKHGHPVYRASSQTIYIVGDNGEIRHAMWPDSENKSGLDDNYKPITD